MIVLILYIYVGMRSILASSYSAWAFMMFGERVVFGRLIALTSLLEKHYILLNDIYCNKYCSHELLPHSCLSSSHGIRAQ